MKIHYYVIAIAVATVSVVGIGVNIYYGVFGASVLKCLVY